MIAKTKLIIKFFIGFTFILNLVFADSLTAKIDRNPVSVGDSFNLIITLQSNDSSDRPKIKIFGNDFRILDTNFQQNLIIKNHQMIHNNTWVISLIARRAGAFTIPAITLGTHKTKPITVHVDPASTLPDSNNKPVYLEVHADKKQSYVQSGVLYTIKLFYHRAIISANFNMPIIKNAIVKSIDKGQYYRTQINNKTYRVFQHNVYIFPQKSGEFTIASPSFSGRLVLGGTAKDSFDGFYNFDNKPILIKAKTLTIKVKPKPSAIKAKNWIPTPHLQLTEHWSQDLSHVQAGTPITRTISIKVTNLLASQLPQLNLSAPENTNIYPSKAFLSNTISNQNIIGLRTQKIVYMPTSSGTIDIPSLKIHWWNTVTNKEETALLPGKKIVVAAANSTQIEQKSNGFNASKTDSGKEKSTPLYWLLSLIMLLIALIFWQRENIVKVKSLFKAKPIKLRKLKKKIYLACLANDAKATRDGLIDWAKLKFPNRSIWQLGDVIKLNLSLALNSAIEDLEKCLYQSEHTKWRGKYLYNAFASIPKKHKVMHHYHDDMLPELYLNKD